jgi:DNA (cytosine-5)-methyltransferase 1
MLNKYSSTLSLAGMKNIIYNKVTPKEAARLQGFPEDFKIPVSDTQAYQQFGNSVPVKVIEAIAKEMLVHI